MTEWFLIIAGQCALAALYIWVGTIIERRRVERRKADPLARAETVQSGLEQRSRAHEGAH